MMRPQILIKYSVDFILAIILLIPVSIVIAVISVFVYFDSPGPVLFRQLRPGKGGKLFTMYKLRTMEIGDHTLTTPRNQDGSLAVTEDLSGYTKVGKWLRRFSLDELPQIFNILKGEMSFIGPRPDLEEHLTLYQGQESKKLMMRPGMTGLAQVNGRNELPWKERLRFDVAYVSQYSLWLDLRILFLTVVRIFSGKGVYTSKKNQE